MKHSESTDDCAKSIEECLSACNTESIKRAGNLFLNNEFDLIEKFVESTNEKLGAEVSKVDFTNSVTVAGIINGWVSEKTDGLINEIISPDTRRFFLGAPPWGPEKFLSMGLKEPQ